MPTTPAPVEYLPHDLGPDKKEPAKPIEKGIGLCLSGGGYRAMLFHLGALWRLQELRLLDPTPNAPLFASLGPLARISSVSGGSITSALLGFRWNEVQTSNPDPTTRIAAFKQHLVDPIRAMSEVAIAGYDAKGAWEFIEAVIAPGSVNDHVTKKYAKHLYGDATLQSLPDLPWFAINASNLQSGSLWRFTKEYMWDWRVGKIEKPKLPLARAVSASSAFPPVLSPAILEFRDSDFVPNSGGTGRDNLQRPPFTTRVELSDGGVYDNMGLETVWKNYQTVLVSNAGRPFGFEEKIPIDWVHQGSRVISVMDNQVGSLRKRLLVDSYEKHERTGTYWGIESDIANYRCDCKLNCPCEKTQILARVTTDLSKKSKNLQEQLINWGYAVCDAAIRSWVAPQLPAPAGFPYPIGVG